MRSRRSFGSRLAIGAITVSSLGLAGIAGPVAPASAAAPPTPLVGLTGMGEIVRLDASTPGTVSAPVAITGLVAGERIVGFDVRPATGELIGIGITGAEGRVYTINPSTGAATQIGTTPFSTSLPAGGTWSVDFNPTVDRVRVVHSGGLNLRVNQTNGTLAATDTAVSAGTVSALAYDRSVAGTTGTTLYVLDGTADRLASMGSINSAPQSPNSGVLNAIGGLGADSQADIAFDIAPASSAFAGTAIATMAVGGTQGLYTVDLRTGVATLQGTVATALIDLAVLAPTPLLALTGDGAGILRFDASSPSVVSGPTAISGLGAGEIIVGFDVRPATGQLIGIGLRGGEGRVYRIDQMTGVATQIGTTPFASGLPADGAWTVDFNPTVDRIRVVHSSGLNLRVNPNNGARADAPTNDTAIAAGTTIAAGAYDRTVATTTATTLYGLDAGTDRLVTIGGLNSTPSPNGGSIVDVGPLGVDATGLIGFDIAPSPNPLGRAFAALQVGSTNGIYAVDLATGTASSIGAIGNGSTAIRDIAVTVPVVAGASQFTAVTPTRLLDTRETGLKPGAGSTTTLQVTGSTVPAGATAVVLNVVGTEASGEGFLTVYPTGESQPLAANQNLVAGQTRGNLVAVKIGAGGAVNVFSQSGTHLVVDVFGYYAPPTNTAGRFTAMPPMRVLDTRTGSIVPAGGSVDVQLTGVGGLPATGVASVVVNITATEALGAGFVTGHATGTARPFTANLNVERPGQTIGNLAILPVSADGKITLFSQSGTHLVADVVGWFGDSSAKGGLAGLYVPLSPSRALDTREAPNTKLGAGNSLDLAIAGRVGVPSAGVAAAVMNLTAVDVTAPGFVTVFPTGAALLEVSSLYGDTSGQIIPSLVTSQLGTGGRVTMYSNAGTHLVADVAGWYTG